jgi:hypothetical protein
MRSSLSGWIPIFAGACSPSILSRCLPNYAAGDVEVKAASTATVGGGFSVVGIDDHNNYRALEAKVRTGLGLRRFLGDEANANPLNVPILPTARVNIGIAF